MLDLEYLRSAILGFMLEELNDEASKGEKLVRKSPLVTLGRISLEKGVLECIWLHANNFTNQLLVVWNQPQEQFSQNGINPEK